jgi:predicted Zn-dependent protease
MNSEDELVGIMGHEVGHVAARHSAKQMSKGVVASGFGLFTAISKVLPTVGGILLIPGELLLLKYSRSDEIQADRLGVEYATRLGYDARDMSSFFQALDRMAAEEEQTPGFLSTHPNPGDRYTNVNELTNEWQEKIDYQPLNLDPNDFLRRIDGIVFGEDPQQGFVGGNMFYHPALRFQLPVPPKWKVVNSAAYLLIVTEKEDAYMQLSLGETESPAEEADAFIEEGGIRLISRETDFVNRLPAEVVESVAGSGSDQLRILSYFIAKDEHVYVLHGVTSSPLYPDYAGVFVHTMEGFDTITNPAALNVSPRRVRVRPAPRNGRFDEVARALGVTKDDLDDVVSMNGRLPDDEVRKGDLIKIIE